MIIIHEGNPGAGKSYDAVRKIIDALKTKRVVYTNIDGMNNPRCLESIAAVTGISRDSLTEFLFFLDRSQVPAFWNVAPPGSFVVIDEAQLYWSSRDSITTKNRDFCDWASTHRHHGYDLLLITQRSERIDTAVRSLSEFRYHYRKVNIFGGAVSKKYSVYTYISDEKKSAFKPQMKTYDVAIFRCYQSYVGDATEKAVFKTPNILKHPIFLFLLFVLLFGGWAFSKSTFATGDPLGYKAVAAKAEKVKQPLPVKGGEAAPPAAAASPSVPGASPPPSVDSIICLPVSAWVKSMSGEVVMVGAYKLSVWERVDSENSLVYVRYSDCPPPVRPMAIPL